MKILNKIKKIGNRSNIDIKKEDSLENMNDLKDYYEHKFQLLQNDLKVINGEMVESFKEHSNLNKDISMKLSENFKLLVDKIHIIEEQLEEKNKIIERYEEGHKYNNNKNTCMDIIDIIRTMEDEITDWDNELNTYIFKQLNSILNDNFVYGYIPSIESDFDPKNSMYNEPVITTQMDLDGKVAKIVHMGYRIKSGNFKHKILRPAEVNVFKYED